MTVKRCTSLNPATLLPGPEDGEPQCCDAELQQICDPRVNLSDVSLTNPDFVFYVDGSASRDPDTGLSKAGYAVVSDHEVILSAPLPSHYSAQALH